MVKKENTVSFAEMLARKNLKRNIHITLKPVGPACNLICDYCFYLDKENLYPEKSGHKQFTMRLDTYEKFLDEYIAIQPFDSEIIITWQGGEPGLLGLGYYKKAVALTLSKYPNHKILFTFQTNGTLLDDDWARFFSEYNFLVGLSIDGPKDLHDAHRINKNEKGTWKRVMHTVELFKKHTIRFNTMTTINATNVKEPLRVYNFLKSIGSTWMQFLPIVEVARENDQGVLEFMHNEYPGDTSIVAETVDPVLFGNFLNRIFDEWYKNDVGSISVNYFENAYAGAINQTPMQCTMQPICGAALVLEHNGDLYSCDHYVFPEFKLGNIHKDDFPMMVNSKQQEKFGLKKELTLSKKCKECSFLPVCGGDCPKHRIAWTGDGEPISYLCQGYKLFFSHTKPFLDKIV